MESREALLELRREHREPEERTREDEAGTRNEHVCEAIQRVPLALSHVWGVPERRYETSAPTVALVTT